MTETLPFLKRYSSVSYTSQIAAPRRACSLYPPASMISSRRPHGPTISSSPPTKTLTKSLASQAVATTGPEFECHPLLCLETAADLHANDVLFTDCISQVCRALRRIEETAHDPESIRNTSLSIATPKQPVSRKLGWVHRYFHSWRIHLLEPWKLPVLRCVRHLVVTFVRPFDRRCYTGLKQHPIDLSVIISMLTKLPGCIILQFDDVEERLPDSRHLAVEVFFSFSSMSRTTARLPAQFWQSSFSQS